jgi:hypothetical protein
MQLPQQKGPSANLPLYLRYPRWFAYTGGVIYFLVTDLISVAFDTALLHYLQKAFLPWEPYVWEFSNSVVILAAVPLIVAFGHRLPIGWSTWRVNAVRHAIGTVVFFAYKASAVIVLRKLMYAALGGHYDLSIVPSVIGSGHSVASLIGIEYLPDARTYLEILAASYVYRFILLQLSGEAREFTKPEAGAPVESLERPQRFLVRKLGKEFLVAVGDIERLEALGNYVNLHVRGHAYPLRSTMSAIELKLDPTRFVRTHRSHIVNLDCLAEIHPLDTGDASLILRSGTVVPCSRNYRSSLRERAASEPVSASTV